MIRPQPVCRQPISHGKSIVRGFTLLEVLIALSIFAICASTLLQQSGRSIRQAAYLETRTHANWIAENELERLHLSDQFAPPGTQEKELTFAKRQWLVSQEVTNTSHKDLRKAVIRVHENNNPQAAHYELVGFLGRY
jgi:general secretion pathway protein I